ncbi:MAG: hypothetical protein SOH59_09850 [Heyndrickxia faecalis]|jgi:hypothetical protein|uniref:Uncharacterized protein n=2 Tax=Heyndrickxia coagulans TaxID=1398 RepID=G2THH8_HEYCO|nr:MULTISPECIES: hypothetical protein [Heyndrickxia]AEP00317.1 hypothetical protein Bcoa_1101 [Heyndrickxia coagulans 36D1]APB38003.1 hypothetical protein BIZ35_15365 [Heyndrickxia coagulans]AWP35701.1 hypothetical protein CYJ15_01065 [Heyndrickxia coagulans]KYC65156.1 hypothetical protein B4098_1075 [Heyndrickxia coagulans]MBQ4912254.1 hypothetical protein [Heyndrickxia faecalis]
MDAKNTSQVIENLENQVERLDKEVYNLNSKVELLEGLLIKIIENQKISPNLLLDIDFIAVKKDLSGEERAEISFFLLKVQKEYMQEGKVPNLEEFHSGLYNVLGVTQNEKEEYPIEISKQLLQKYDKIGEFPVAKEILSKS